MANYSEDLRKIMNRLDESTQVKILDEAALAEEILGEDFVDDIQNMFGKTGTSIKAALGNNQAKGEKARDQLRSRFEKEWKEFLGRTDRKGSMEDMLAFLVKRVGFQPNDLNTIIGSNVAPAAQDAADEVDDVEDDEAEEVQVDKTPDPNPEKEASGPKFTHEDGTTDLKAVRKELSKMKPGERLEVNGKTYFIPADDEDVEVGTRTVPAESIGESILMEFDIRKPLNLNYVRKILNRAAAHAFDTYLMNRPSDAGAYGGYDQGEEGEGDGEDNTGGPNSNEKTSGTGNVNLNKMWASLQKEGLEREDIRELRQMIGSTRSLRSVKDPAAVKMLAAVGYAFLKARK